ncbi:MAG: GNAT family N-acetyltransferase [Bacteroidales bacterium]|nr:GNAT family N-acetyltransferase [Bacteroidales bacterium]
MLYTKNFASRPIGKLYRDYTAIETTLKSEITASFARHADLPFLTSIDDEVFEPKELIKKFVKGKSILIFRISHHIIGCGFITKIHPEYSYYDLGVWVHPRHRLQGYAIHILSYLKTLCIKKKGIPVCGCDINNTGSQKALHKAGFSSHHVLFEFSVS